MDYVELNIPVGDAELSEILIAELAELPFDSFDEGEGLLKAYIPATKLADNKHFADEILVEHNIKGARYIEIETQNWNAVWESQFEPVEIEGKLVIRAPFHKPIKARGNAAEACFSQEIIIMPKMSFGTGHHATTRLMAAEMLERDLAGRRVLDMGSGTGVLAILAAKLGAAAVMAVDIDDLAYENARENIAVNGVEGIVKPVLGDVSAIGGERYDVVLANINRNILLADMPSYVGALNSGGELIISGFFETDIPALEHRALCLGLRKTTERIMDGWAVVSFRI